MGDPLAKWDRPHFEPGGGEPYLFYVVYGDVDTDAPLSRSAYRSEGIPEGIDLSRYTRAEHPDVFAGFESGPLGQQLRSSGIDIAAAVEQASACLILRGTLPDSPDLDYLRNSIGLLTWCLDNGGCIIFDAQALTWWRADKWRETIFEPGKPDTGRHVTILCSEDDRRDTKWFHTRGMRKFGRPDISVRHVPPAHESGIIDLCNRLIELQGLGAIVAEGREIDMATLPPGGTARHGGDLDDPDFNNFHIEIAWPNGL